MSSLRLLLSGLAAGFVATAVIGGLVVLGGPAPLPPIQVDAGGATATPAPASAAPATAVPATIAPAPTPTPLATPSAPASPSAAPATAFGVGSPAPTLRLPRVGGGIVDLASYRGRPIWIQFTATWCPSCRDDAAAMTIYGDRHRGAGLTVLAVDVREDEATVAAFAELAGTTYRIGLDLDGTAARRWGVVALPTHFFIDASGVVRGGATGSIPRDRLASLLREILPGETVEP